MRNFPMSGEGFDQREMLGVAAALHRCRALAARIASLLATDIPLRDTAALAEVHADLRRAAELLDLANQRQARSVICISSPRPGRRLS
jgi:hypothetical protein